MKGEQTVGLSIAAAVEALEPDAPIEQLKSQMNALYLACKCEGGRLGELLALELGFSASVNRGNAEGVRRKARFLKQGP
ncbi:hypothetical protein [Meiothermus granaticius]|uniref:Uncharacterized protein n=1 Tax=Meiothermus granaticius NBRC 107808 TaxID=1227551 RepID=A0A399FDY0_9DEIN|nr:hypothetical protein [Meiothermus granaticius]RIH94015.1 hypothetical protein Mgrana_00101 [Meiothermus granaticius NBRC 107808]GEM88156.1 hypothetical protein MGR01S_27810 [Meiothermus granaticius NBRC 107808]